MWCIKFARSPLKYKEIFYLYKKSLRAFRVYSYNVTWFTIQKRVVLMRLHSLSNDDLNFKKIIPVLKKLEKNGTVLATNAEIASLTELSMWQVTNALAYAVLQGWISRSTSYVANCRGIHRTIIVNWGRFE